MRYVIAATGPSLTPDVVARCAAERVIAIGDAFRMFPRAFAVVALDGPWWKVRYRTAEMRAFKGLRIFLIARREAPKAFEIECMESVFGCSCIICDYSGESFVPLYPNCCGLFGAISYALHIGADEVVLVGADMRNVNGKRRFCDGEVKPMPGIKPAPFKGLIPYFERAVRLLPAGVSIVNATPGSALKCFPMRPLEAVLASRM